MATTLVKTDFEGEKHNFSQYSWPLFIHFVCYYSFLPKIILVDLTKVNSNEVHNTYNQKVLLLWPLSFIYFNHNLLRNALSTVFFPFWLLRRTNWYLWVIQLLFLVYWETIHSESNADMKMLSRVSKKYLFLLLTEK